MHIESSNNKRFDGSSFRKDLCQWRRSLLVCGSIGLGLFPFSLVASPASVYATSVLNPDQPAKVVYVGQNGDGPFVVFNQGSLGGYVIGRDVCFYNQDYKKISCATIVRTKPHAAAANVNLSVPSTETTGDTGVATAGDSPIPMDALVWPQDLGELTDSDWYHKLQDDEDDPPEPILPPVLTRRFQFHLAPTYALPVWMDDLRFSSAARSSGTGKIWQGGDTIKGSVVGFGGRYYWPQNGRGDMALDMTYHFVPQSPVVDDFDVTDASTTVKSEVWASHYRLRWLRGATFFHADDGKKDFLLYTGLGYDYLVAKFRSAKQGGSTDELVSGTITGHAFEIPAVLTWQQIFGPVLVNVGADFSLPVGIFGVKSKGSVSYSDNVQNADKSFDAAVNAVNVHRGWFAVAINLGVGASF